LKLFRVFVFGLLLASARGAGAQPPPPPIGAYVVDVRGALARFKEDPNVAAAIDVDVKNLPTRGLGLATGAHWYPLRRGRITFGLGAEVMFARDSRSIEATGTTPASPTVSTRVSAIAPQLSFNFGHRDGWSYISGGTGWARLTSTREDATAAGSAGRTRAINYGGGARWFTSPRRAFTFDVRFYAISPRAATSGIPGYPRQRLMVISVGVSFR
jgi:hypothetical protein